MKNIFKWALQSLSPTELTLSVIEEHNRYLKAPKGISTCTWATIINKAKWGDFLPGSRIKSSEG